MKKIKNVYDSNNGFVSKKKTDIKYFLKLCKYDIIPAAFVTSTFTATAIPAYNHDGLTELLILGGVVGTSLALAVNGAITGVRISKEKREEIKETLENNDEKGKTL